MYKGLYCYCDVCGEPAEPTVMNLYTGGNVCDNKACIEAARIYSEEKDKILGKFADEKERVLRPLKSQLDTELFLLERKYLKGKQILRRGKNNG